MNSAAGSCLRGAAKAERHPLSATLPPAADTKNCSDREPSRGSILSAVKVYYFAQAAEPVSY
jgi:hypothetical protein